MKITFFATALLATLNLAACGSDPAHSAADVNDAQDGNKDTYTGPLPGSTTPEDPNVWVSCSGKIDSMTSFAYGTGPRVDDGLVGAVADVGLLEDRQYFSDDEAERYTPGTEQATEGYASVTNCCPPGAVGCCSPDNPHCTARVPCLTWEFFMHHATNTLEIRYGDQVFFSNLCAPRSYFESGH